MRLWPGIVTERWMLLLARHPPLRQMPFISDRLAGWRSIGFMTRVALFVLGVVAAVASYAVLDALRLQPMLVGGLLAVGVAEWLIASRQLSHTGMEEALHVIGLLTLAYWLLNEVLVISWQREAWAVVIAFAAAGWRLRNPLFTSIAAIAIAMLLKRNGYLNGDVYMAGSSLWAGLYCYGLAGTTLWLGRIHYQRPFHDHVLDWLVVVMPVAGYVAWTGDSWWSFSGNATAINWLAVGALALFGVLTLVTGLWRRTHAPLIACLLCVACLAYELRNATGLSLQARLIMWGVITLIVALVLDRWLRTPRQGITSKQFSDREGPLDLLPMAGAALNTPASAAPGERGMQSGGGEFGGGGASGHF